MSGDATPPGAKLDGEVSDSIGLRSEVGQFSAPPKCSSFFVHCRLPRRRQHHRLDQALDIPDRDCDRRANHQQQDQQKPAAVKQPESSFSNFCLRSAAYGRDGRGWDVQLHARTRITNFCRRRKFTRPSSIQASHPRPHRADTCAHSPDASRPRMPTGSFAPSVGTVRPAHDD